MKISTYLVILISYSSLLAIASGRSICRTKLVTAIIALVSKYSINITFIWLPSHTGIKGNELADSLAVAAVAHTKIDVDIGLELSEAYNLVDRYILSKWQHIWDHESRGTHFRKIEKSVSTKLKYCHSSRQREVVITRFRLNMHISSDW